jgi:hypothetical protein
MLKTFPDLDLREIRRRQRKYWTAFKHATHLHGEGERDDDKLLREFTDDQNDHALFIGWYDYALAVNKLPIEAQAYQIWYIALYPEKLDPKHSIDRYEKTFPNLRTKSRDEQKQMLNFVIGRARSDASLMNDPQTDSRRLVIGWPP